MLNGLILIALVACTGASCPRNRQLVNDYAPIVFSEEPTLEDVIRAVNGNSARIERLESDGATLDIPSYPAIEANYAVERPRRFRLRAEAGVMGTVLDLGSNDDVYWMWARHSDEPGVFWGRHDEFYRSAAKQMLPIPPDWLIEAVGIVQLDPTGHHEGPYRNADGHLEVRSYIQTAGGGVTKLTVVDDTRGWVLQQHLFDHLQRPLASSLASGFDYDEITGASLPRHVQIHLPALELSFTLRTERHRINMLSGDPQQLWTPPQMPDSPLVDLDDPSMTTFRTAPSLLARRPKRMAVRQRRRVPVRRDPAIRQLPPFDRLR